jgi:hypothetical protein
MEAPGVTRLVRLVYDDSYYPRDLYDPEQIVCLNQSGRLVSVVAVNSADDVVGHYALERSNGGLVAEASDAIVQPEFRHHHILEQMRLRLRDEAINEGLTGLVGYAVTNHVFTQKAEEHFGAHPCGIALGLWPRSFHNMPEALTQRMSFAIYFKFLRRPERVRHIATRHHAMIARIFQQFEIAVDIRDDKPPEGVGELSVEQEEAVGTGSIRVHRIGTDSVEVVLNKCRELCANSGVKALTLELPLNQAGVTALYRAAEDIGFYFSGIGPSFANNEDALLLQLTREEIDSSLLEIDHPFSKELLSYVDGERRRLRQSNGY